MSGYRAGVGYLAVASLCAVFGAMIAGKVDAFLGAKLPLVLLAVAAAAALFVAFAHLGFAALMAWPVLSAVAYPFVRVPAGNPVITFDRVWIGGLVAAVALGVRDLRRAQASRSFLLALLLLTVAYGVRSLSGGASAGESGGSSLWIDAIVLPAIVFLVTTRFATTRQRCEQIGGALTIGGAALALIGVLESLFGFSLVAYSHGQVRHESELGVIRISGPYPLPEPYALSLVICLAACLYWTQTRSGKARLIGIAIAAVDLVAIGLTLFRAAWIAAALVIVASLGLRPKRFARALLLAGAIAALAFGASTQLAARGGLGQRVHNSGNIWGRFATYEQGLEIFRSAPLWGVGVGRLHERGRFAATEGRARRAVRRLPAQLVHGRARRTGLVRIHSLAPGIGDDLAAHQCLSEATCAARRGDPRSVGCGSGTRLPLDVADTDDACLRRLEQLLHDVARSCLGKA